MQVTNKYRRDDSKGGNRTNPVEGLSMYRLGEKALTLFPEAANYLRLGVVELVGVENFVRESNGKAKMS